MTTHEAAQKLIQAVRSGERSVEYMQESIRLAESYIARGKALAPFTCEEMAEVVALVKAELFPQEQSAEQGAEILAASVPASLVVEIVPKAVEGWSWVERYRLATLTTAHYGQLDLVRNGAVIEYAEIAGIHLLEEGTLEAYLEERGPSDASPSGREARGVSVSVWQAVQAALAPLGLQVTRHGQNER